MLRTRAGCAHATAVSRAGIDEAAGLALEAGTSPDLAPAVLRDDALKIAVEIVDIAERAVDVSVAQNLFAFGKADIVALLVHAVSSLK